MSVQTSKKTTASPAGSDAEDTSSNLAICPYSGDSTLVQGFDPLFHHGHVLSPYVTMLFAYVCSGSTGSTVYI